MRKFQTPWEELGGSDGVEEGWRLAFEGVERRWGARSRVAGDYVELCGG